ncbi:MAG: hypothetical protein JOZ19_00910 [Rubrobacter sp.]|nr:hypothetical protein [Rubrobacter sp.]
MIKVDRAKVRLSTLDKEVRSFLDSGAHEIQPKFDGQTGEVVIYVEPHEKPPILEWSAIIGDIVHNLRSALDHLVGLLPSMPDISPPP